MISKKNPGRLIAGVMATIFLAFLGWIYWQAVDGNGMAFLDRRTPAEWILYPKPPDGRVHRSADLSTKFHRTLVLDAYGGQASLSIRAMKHWLLSINGAVLDTSAAATTGWKEPKNLDISAWLHPGTNEITVTVVNPDGPPALWLVLETGGQRMVSGVDWDASFVGAVWRKTALVSAPIEIARGTAFAGAERALPALKARLPLLMLFTLLSAGMVFFGYRHLKQPRRADDRFPKFAAAGIGLAALLWMVLGFNNLGWMPNRVGFDSREHIEYIEYIKIHRSLPLADQGWQMYQAPFYYLVSAGLTAPFHAVGISDRSYTLIRVMGLGIGILHFMVVFLGLRLLFPDRFGPQFFGLILAAFIPENLYLSHYITNESLCATLTTAALYLCLRILRTERDSAWEHAGLGLLLGAALLTKMTAIIATPFIGVALIGRLATRGRCSPFTLLRTVGLTFAAAAIVCGWYYFRVWAHFGKVLVGNWDAAVGNHWWMEPGYTVGGYFLHFGQSLIYPWFGGFGSFWDGLYSTLWGDGLWGGEANFNYRPPWNYELMAAGYLLALLPTCLILGGCALAVRKLVRRPDLSWFLLIGVGFSTLAALVYMSLKVPNYAEAKSFYGLIALLPICAFGALAWEVIQRRSGAMLALTATMFGLWAINSYASLWIRHWDPEAALARTRDLRDDGKLAEAHLWNEAALERFPDNARARMRVALDLDEEGRFDEAEKLIERTLKDAPDDAQAHLIKSSILASQNKVEPAIGEAQKSIDLAPELADGYAALCELLVKANRGNEAVAAGRDGLGADPLSAELHYDLGTAFSQLADEAQAGPHFRLAAQLKPNWPEAQEQSGLSLLGLKRWREAADCFERAVQLNPGNAKFQYNLAVALEALGREADSAAGYRLALQIDPEYPQALNNLAWLLATDAESALRDGPEAVKLAERACELSGRQQPVYLATLGAAYAEAGRFTEAVTVTAEAIAQARTAGNQNLAAANEKLLELYRSGHPYHQPSQPGR